VRSGDIGRSEVCSRYGTSGRLVRTGDMRACTSCSDPSWSCPSSLIKSTDPLRACNTACDMASGIRISGGAVIAACAGSEFEIVKVAEGESFGGDVEVGEGLIDTCETSLVEHMRLAWMLYAFENMTDVVNGCAFLRLTCALCVCMRMFVFVLLYRRIECTCMHACMHTYIHTGSEFRMP
jgi:hypothetical protein